VTICCCGSTRKLHARAAHRFNNPSRCAVAARPFRVCACLGNGVRLLRGAAVTPWRWRRRPRVAAARVRRRNMARRLRHRLRVPTT
jgi:hypothetical protein